MQRDLEKNTMTAPVDNKPTMAMEFTGLSDDSIVVVEPISLSVKRFLSSHHAQEQNPQSSRIVVDDIKVEGTGTGALPAPSVLTDAKSGLGLLEPILKNMHRPSSRLILHGFSAAIEPGEMILVIGKPGSGCTTFLKILAGMWSEYKGVQGNLTFGGEPMSSIIDKHPQDAVFCEGESDDHFPTLTVFETLRFAVRARSGPQLSASEIDEKVQSLAQLVGLSHVLNTKVGDAYVRGVSGGERRRVSLAEALATRARLICLDNPTNGLDSSTTLEFMEMMREWTTQSQCVTAMSVYQGSDAVVPYFDKVIVINGGHQIFYGTIPEAKAYFSSLGFECSSATTTTDFLNSMSADPGVRRVHESYKSQVPRTPSEFQSRFRSSPHFKALQSSVQISKSLPAVIRPGKSHQYALPLYQQIAYCAMRQVRIIQHNYSAILVEAICIVVQSLILGTLFRNQQRNTGSLFIFASALFYSVLVPALQAMAEFRSTFAQRQLILKHKRYRLYRPMAYGFGLIMTDIVWKIFVVFWNIPLYFLTGFQQDASHFFTWFIVVYVEHLALSMFFRSVAVFSSNMYRAVLPVGIFFNMYVLYTGLYVPIPQMQAWLGWLRYLNPLHYGFESVMINEFASLTYECSTSDLVPSGPDYNDIANQVCAVVGSEPGQRFVSGMSYIRAQYGFEEGNLWRDLGVNVAFFIIFGLAAAAGMERLKQPAGRLATVFYRGMKSTKSSPGSKSGDQESGPADLDVPPIQDETTPDARFNERIKNKSSSLTWTRLNFDVQTKDGQKRLLSDINGLVHSGHMKALMGVSGAGKTTLLNALAGRSKTGTLSGTLALNGKILSRSFNRHMGYVQQQDIHLPTQSVREALQMTARLRRPQEFSLEEKDAYVEEVIRSLDMASIANALIGTPGAGLNLEQRKRVSIGVEMAAKPDILFLDEPTSGLDGQSAYSIVRLLRKLADSGQAIICTIHQPAAELIGIFDELYLLARGGKVVYDGPLGKDCEKAIAHFALHARPCREGENPAEYFLEIIGAGTRRDVQTDWAEIWKKSHEKGLEGHNAVVPSETNHTSDFGNDNPQSLYAAPFHYQLFVMVKRTWLYYWREPDYVRAKFWLNAGNALLNGMTYLNSPSTQQGAYNRVFSSFMSLIVGPPLGLQIQPRFVTLRNIFEHRERESLTYHWLTFNLSAIIVELPYAFFTSLVYWLLWYFPTGYYQDSNHAGYSFLMYQLFSVFATSLAQLCASLMPTVEAALSSNGFFFMFCNTFAGTLSPKPVTPSGWSWYYKVSPLFYLNEGIVVDVLHNLPLHCTDSEVSIFQPLNGTTCYQYAESFLKTATGFLVNPDSAENCQYCPYKDGQSYYTQYDYSYSHRARNVGVFIGFIAFNFTMVLVITYLTRVRGRH
ncbi:hypothetical protein N7478_005211 [Penicillium angulare]|uniref:uncharacterized protein n=1 Tax=Penicillium angulare TaxID=116970 RepID=UPI002541138C|nr:uncharacterized protein N7478_005211 [Penicillium angulare]KAJ5279839.1 hypothetical protein N7478_005211 [Penicillium angulare]